jgi:hypothetical protein
MFYVVILMTIRKIIKNRNIFSAILLTIVNKQLAKLSLLYQAMHLDFYCTFAHPLFDIALIRFKKRAFFILKKDQ